MNQQPQPTQPYHMNRHDEFDFKELWKIICQHKFLIVMLTGLSSLGAYYYAYNLPGIYTARVMIVSHYGSGARRSGLAALAGITTKSSLTLPDEALTRLETRHFLLAHIKEKNLKTILFSDRWNEIEKEWIDKEPSDTESFKLFLSMISVVEDHPRKKDGLTSIHIKWENPKNPNDIVAMANDLVHSMNYHAKSRIILESRKNIKFLENEMDTINFVESKKIIYSLIEGEIKKNVLANTREDLVWRIIDPAYEPIPMPRFTIQIVGVAAIISLILGVFSAFFIEGFYSRKNKVIV